MTTITKLWHHQYSMDSLLMSILSNQQQEVGKNPEFSILGGCPIGSQGQSHLIKNLPIEIPDLNLPTETLPQKIQGLKLRKGDHILLTEAPDLNPPRGILEQDFLRETHGGTAQELNLGWIMILIWMRRAWMIHSEDWTILCQMSQMTNLQERKRN